MDKRLIYPQNVGKERDLFFVREDRNYLRKHASGYHPEIAAYIEKAKPLEGLIQVLLTALGATPFWPQNVNGDDFPVSALKHGGDDYGYKTFTSNANYFTHHCFTASNMVRTRSGYVPIGEIQVGDEVLTHTGKYQPVTETYRSNYDGDLIEIQVQGRGRSPVCTSDHPFLVCRKSSLKCRGYGAGYKNYCTYYRSSDDACRLCKQPRKSPAVEWVAADQLQVGDYLVSTADETVLEAKSGLSSSLLESWGGLIGLFLAEGSYTKKRGKRNGICFTFSSTETALIERLKGWSLSLGYKLTGPYFHPKNNTALVVITSEKLATTLYKFCGEYSHTKHITRECQEFLGAAGLLSLVGGYVDGDGHVYTSGRNKGIVRIRSVNFSLLETVRDICFSLSIPCTFNIDSKQCRTNAAGITSSPSAVLSFNAAAASSLSKQSLKCSKLDHTRRKKGSSSFSHGTISFHQIRGIVKRPVKNTPVFNLEVSTDHSYQVFGLNTHNCNKDPALAKGKVLHAVWNDDAKRVELIIGIDPKLDPDAQEIVDRGESLCFSMGCFIGGTQVRLADYSTKSIEEVRVGDLIINGKGNQDTVTELHQRPYTGKLLSIKSIGEEPLYLTPEHPILAVKFREVSGYWPNGLKKPARTKNLKAITPKWMGARHLERDDFIAVPVNMEEETADWLSADLMRLFGYYLAEGHIINRAKRPVGIVLSTHMDDPIHDEIHGILSRLKVKTPPTVRSNPRHSKYLRLIEIYDERLANLMVAHCGSYAQHKYLSKELMLADPKLQLELLGAYLNGDGWQCQDKSHKDVAMFSTCSERVAYQTQIILARCGILAKINKVKHAAGIGFNYHDTVEYQVYCSINGTNILSTVSKKIKPTNRVGQRCGRRRIVENYILTSVKEVSEIEFSGTVYNLEVKDDPSYLVSRVAVHNCKLPFDVCTICSNKAKTRAEYCDHLRYQINQIDPVTGKLVGAINYFPKFFDISRVLIPADKTAYMWEKIASAAPNQNVFSKLGSAALADVPAGKLSDIEYLNKVAEESQLGRPIQKTAIQNKKAEIKKQIIAVQPQADAYLSKMLPRVKQALDARSPSLPPELFEGVESLKEALTTLLALGIVPKPAESKTLSDIFVGKPAGVYKYSPMLAERLLPYIPLRSFAAPVLVRRLSILVRPLEKSAAQSPTRHNPEAETSHFEQGMKRGILAALAFLLAPEGLKNLVLNHPIPLLMAGAPLVAAGRVLTSHKPLTSGEYDLVGPSDSLYNEDWRSRFARSQARPVAVIKTGEDLSQASQRFRSTWSGVSGLIGLSDLWCDDSGLAVSSFGSQFPALLENSILSKSAKEIGEASQIVKTAFSLLGEGNVSLDDLPRTDRTITADLVVLGLVETLMTKKGERHNG